MTQMADRQISIFRPWPEYSFPCELCSPVCPFNAYKNYNKIYLTGGRNFSRDEQNEEIGTVLWQCNVILKVQTNNQFLHKTLCNTKEKKDKPFTHSHYLYLKPIHKNSEHQLWIFRWKCTDKKVNLNSCTVRLPATQCHKTMIWEKSTLIQIIRLLKMTIITEDFYSYYSLFKTGSLIKNRFRRQTTKLTV